MASPLPAVSASPGEYEEDVPECGISASPPVACTPVCAPIRQCVPSTYAAKRLVYTAMKPPKPTQTPGPAPAPKAAVKRPAARFASSPRAGAVKVTKSRSQLAALGGIAWQVPPHRASMMVIASSE